MHLTVFQTRVDGQTVRTHFLIIGLGIVGKHSELGDVVDQAYITIQRDALRLKLHDETFDISSAK